MQSIFKSKDNVEKPYPVGLPTSRNGDKVTAIAAFQALKCNIRSHVQPTVVDIKQFAHHERRLCHRSWR